MRRRGGGHKRRLRPWIAEKIGVPARCAHRVRSRLLGASPAHYADGEKRYILAPVGLTQGSTVVSYGLDVEAPEVAAGNHMLIIKIPLAPLIHNIEMRPGKGGRWRKRRDRRCLMAKEGVTLRCAYRRVSSAWSWRCARRPLSGGQYAA